MQKILIILIFSFFCISSFAQKWKLTRYEAIIGIGTANYFGDIGGTADENNWYGLKDIEILSTRPALVVGARYKILQDLSVKLNLATIMISGSDAGSKNDTRNHSFNTYGLEHSLQLEYSFISEDARQRSFAYYNRRGMLNNFSRKSVYAFGGVGGFAALPYFTKGADYSTDVIDDSFNYTGVLLSGLGVKMIWNNYISIGAEFGVRYAFNDFLDGFQNPKFGHEWFFGMLNVNDIYYFTSVNLIYRIKTSRKGYPILFRNY